MIKTQSILIEELAGYGAPANKLMRMARAGEVTPIVRGLYETDPSTPAHLVAASIYGPSYVSFEWALSYYDLIPERVCEVTCATFEKGRKKSYDTPLGRLTYRDVPSAAFPLGLVIKEENGRPFRIASPEKALCDQLCKMPPAASQAELRLALVGGLRISTDDIAKLNTQVILDWRNAYRKTNVTLLCKLIEREAL